MNSQNGPLEAFLNPGSGSADTISDFLGQQANARVRQLEVPALRKALKQAAAKGTRRVVICGGDGTLALAAGILAGTATEMAVLPGGTLNHFSERVGISADWQSAWELATTGTARHVDVGYVNDHLFINTCAAGAYVTFVRSREHLEKRMNYSLASLLAGVRRLVRMRPMRIELDGQIQTTPLVFVGVGKRELQFPSLGQATPEGHDGLHVIALRTKNGWETLKLAFNAALRGIDPLSRECQVEQKLIDRLEIQKKGKNSLLLAVDGEIIRLVPPLRFRYEPTKLRVVVPGEYQLNPPEA